MSNFYAMTLAPDRDTAEVAEWLDDYYGKHCYGVRFSDGKIYPETEVQKLYYCDPDGSE